MEIGCNLHECSPAIVHCAYAHTLRASRRLVRTDPATGVVYHVLARHSHGQEIFPDDPKPMSPIAACSHPRPSVILCHELSNR